MNCIWETWFLRMTRGTYPTKSRRQNRPNVTVSNQQGFRTPILHLNVVRAEPRPFQPPLRETARLGEATRWGGHWTAVTRLPLILTPQPCSLRATPALRRAVSLLGFCRLTQRRSFCLTDRPVTRPTGRHCSEPQRRSSGPNHGSRSKNRTSTGGPSASFLQRDVCRLPRAN